MLLSVAAFAQTIAFNNFSLTLPQSAQKLDSKMVPSKVASISSTGTSEISRMPSADIYSINGSLARFWNVKMGSGQPVRSMEDVKSEMTGLYSLPSAYHLQDISIKTVNGNKYLIIKYERDGGYYFHFLSDKVERQGLNGILQYQKSNENDAVATLNQILSGITVKK